MTTLVTTQRPLQVISMSSENGRRLSKRLAASTATDYEHDDDFAFVRKAKRVKTDKADEPELEVKPAPVKKTAKGRTTKQRAAKAPTTNGTIVEEDSVENETVATTKPTTRKSGRRKASVDASEEPKTQAPKKQPTRRSTRRSGEKLEDEVPQPAPAPAPVSAPEPEPEPQPETVPLPEEAPAPRANGASKKRGNRAKSLARPPPDWDKSPPRAVPVESATIALPMSDTPIINRNKEMRKKGNGNRRSSLGNRGRRASSLIESGQTAIPHREVNPAEFYKHIEAEGLTEPRRMKQLLTWCGERALAGKPRHGTPNSNAILGARAIQDQLLKDFAARSEFSDWFSREDDAPKAPVVLKPNPRNMELDEKLAQLEINVKRLQDEKKAWQAIRKPPPEQPSLFSEDETGPIVLPDFDLLDPDEGKIRGFLEDEKACFDTVRSQTESRLRTIQSSLEFQVDQLADNIHKIEQRVLVAGKEADKVLSISALRLRQREERERASAGTKEMPVIEVLRSLGNILPEGGG
ncbi:Mis12-Mtw1 protein family-domain-containing protein [Fusarium tricinctum]|uniref:Mis12-Mtw1 protein family-domain-containing protein n=1 Tax=Fusarium tricinctum TaxID=61284 RepID=A0A8K0WH93_9HYPO|nr:Mis12-Mtw1 protein family-domain-containing protein [Fusarium tricinctum]